MERNFRKETSKIRLFPAEESSEGGSTDAPTTEDVVMDITGVNGMTPVTAASPAPAAPEQAVVNRDIVQAVNALNAAQSFGDNHELTFQLDRNTKLAVIRIIDRRTQEVVEQIPAEYILRLAENLPKSSE